MNLALQQLQNEYSGVRPVVSRKLDQHWNRKLRKKHALAPADWLLQGLVTDSVYEHQNNHWAQTFADYMLEELGFMHRELGVAELHSGCFTLNGPGLFRDGGWIPTANSLGLLGMICEAATFPYKLAEKRLAAMSISDKNMVRLVEIKGWPGEIHPSTKLIVDSGFKGILPRSVMEAQGRAEGVHLAQSRLKWRIVIAHATKMQNTADVLWGDRIVDDLKKLLAEDFPYHNRGVLWGDHNAYEWEELIAPIARGLGKPVQVVRGLEFPYYHQRWEIKTLVAA